MKPLIHALFLYGLVTSLLPAQTNINKGLSSDKQLRFEVAKELRQTEKYQLIVAQRFFAKGVSLERTKKLEALEAFKAAMSEFEKFLTLYERSEAAPYAQIMWSHCLVSQRKQYTAIRDGYQSVIDYWPESPEAALAAYLIGKTYKDIGEIKNAIKAFDKVREVYPQKHESVLALWEILKISKLHQDEKLRLKILKELTFEIKRTKANDSYLVNAAKELAGIYFNQGDGPKGLEALLEQEGASHMGQHGGIRAHAYNISMGAIGHLLGKKETVKAAEKLADQVIKFLNGRIPEDLEKGKAKEKATDCLYKVASLHASVKRDKEVLDTYKRLGGLIGMNDDVLGRIASWHKTKKRREEARKTYERFKNKINGLEMIAKMYAEDKDPDGAKKIYGKIIQLDKKNEPKWAGDSAGVYRDCEKPEQAVEIYTYIASIDQENKVKWFGEVGDTWKKAEKYEKAVQTYTYIASIDQENKGKWFQKIAETWQGVGEYKKAIGSWRKVIASTGEANHYKAIGYCYEKLKDIPKAIQSYRLSDDFPWAYFKMGDLHRDHKQWKEALVLYNQARSFGDSNAQNALWRIGDTYERSSRREQAIRSYQSICKLYPKSGIASRAHAHLQNKYKINITLGGAKEE